MAELRAVLAPTDLSAIGAAAVPFAYAIVAPGCVHLLHVVEPPTVPNPLYAHYSPGRRPTQEERERQERDLRARLEALVPPSAEGREIRTEIELVEGHEVAELVCQTAERLDVDAICIGSHGRSGLARALLGSVTQSVLRTTRRPVLIVRPRNG